MEHQSPAWAPSRKRDGFDQLCVDCVYGGADLVIVGVKWVKWEYWCDSPFPHFMLNKSSKLLQVLLVDTPGLHGHLSVQACSIPQGGFIEKSAVSLVEPRA